MKSGVLITAIFTGFGFSDCQGDLNQDGSIDTEVIRVKGHYEHDY